MTTIERHQIPNNLYLTKKVDDSEWNHIYLVEFSNGLKYVYGSDYEETFDDILENLDEIMDHVNNSNNQHRFKKHYYDMLGSVRSIENCNNIWNYFNANKNLIEQVFDHYMN